MSPEETHAQKLWMLGIVAEPGWTYFIDPSDMSVRRFPTLIAELDDEPEVVRVTEIVTTTGLPIDRRYQRNPASDYVVYFLDKEGDVSIAARRPARQQASAQS